MIFLHSRIYGTAEKSDIIAHFGKYGNFKTKWKNLNLQQN